jgi:hypothetical protein
MRNNREVRELNRWYRSAHELPTTPTLYVSLYNGSGFPAFRDSFAVAWSGIPDDARKLLVQRWRDLELDWCQRRTALRIRVPFIAVTDPWEVNLMETLGLMVGVALRSTGHFSDHLSLRTRLSRVFLTYSTTESDTPSQWMPTVIAIGLANAYLKFVSGEDYSPVGCFMHDDRYELATDWGFPVAAFETWDEQRLMQDDSSDNDAPVEDGDLESGV